MKTGNSIKSVPHILTIRIHTLHTPVPFAYVEIAAIKLMRMVWTQCNGLVSAFQCLDAYYACGECSPTHTTDLL